MIMRCYYPLLIVVFLLLLTQTGQAQEGDYGLLWSYEADGALGGVSISSNGSYVAATSNQIGCKVHFLNKEGELLRNSEVGSYGVKDVAISSDGSCVAAEYENFNIHVFDREGELLWSYETCGYVDYISISSDGEYIAATSNCIGYTVYFFTRSGELLWSYATKSTSDYVTGVSISADGQYIAVGLAAIRFTSLIKKESFYGAMRLAVVRGMLLSLQMDHI